MKKTIDKINKANAALTKSLSAPRLILSEDFKKSMDSFRVTMEATVKAINLQLKPIIESFVHSISTVQKLIDKSLTSKLIIIFNIEKYKPEIIEMSTDEVESSIEDIVLSCKDGILPLMLDSWKKEKFLKDRINLLSDAVNTIIALEKNKINASTCVIPFLMSQIDYLLINLCKKTEKFKSRERVTGKKKRELLYELALTTEYYVLNTVLDILFVNDDGERYKKYKKLGHTLFRNDIEHGESLNYNTRLNLVKILLILDFLISNFEQISVNLEGR